MNWLDLVLLVILAVSVATSFRKGLSREVIGLVAVLLALIFGFWFYGIAAALVLPYLSSRAAANLAGFFLVFFGVVLLGSIVSYVVGRFLRVTGLSFVDHALGAVFGLARGTLVAMALIMGIMAFSPGDQPPESVVNSRLAPYTVDAARFVVSMAPHDLREGFRKSYAQVKTAWQNAMEKGIRTTPNVEKGEHERKI
jgi:membrane protein required for colicin V production